MNLQSSFIIFSLLCSCRPSKITWERAREVRTHHVQECATETPSPRWDPPCPVRSRLCSDLSSCPGRRSTHISSCTAALPAYYCHRGPSRPTTCSLHEDNGAIRAPYDNVTPPCPSTGTMIRLSESVLFCKPAAQYSCVDRHHALVQWEKKKAQKTVLLSKKHSSLVLFFRNCVWQP